MILKEKVPFIRGMLIYLGMGVMMFATYLQMIQKKKKKQICQNVNDWWIKDAH